MRYIPRTSALFLCDITSQSCLPGLSTGRCNGRRALMAARTSSTVTAFFTFRVGTGIALRLARPDEERPGQHARTINGTITAYRNALLFMASLQTGFLRALSEYTYGKSRQNNTIVPVNPRDLPSGHGFYRYDARIVHRRGIAVTVHSGYVQCGRISWHRERFSRRWEIYLKKLLTKKYPVL